MSTSTQPVTDIKKQKRKKGKKMIKKLIKALIIIVLLAAAVIFGLYKLGFIGSKDTIQQAKFQTYTVSTRSITKVLTSSGTIEPNDQYTISALVNGEIIADNFEKGDTVIEDQLLFKIDSDSLNSGVTRAENALKNANKDLENALKNLEKLNIATEVTGTVKKIHIDVGDEIKAGDLIADIVDDETMCIDIPFMNVDIESISVGDDVTVTFENYEETKGTVSEISPISYINNLGVSVRDVTVNVDNTGSITTSTKAFGQIGDAYCTASGTFYYNDEGQVYSKIAGEVTEINYKEGQRIFDGQIIARLKSEELEENIEKLRDNVKEAEDSLEDANDAFDNYNIQAPITGKVISKSYKTGDTISSGMSGSNTLAVIYDMSALKFSMNIDELDIDKLEEGQDVIITCDSREGEEYHGIISNISIQGSTSNGTTVYPVEVIVENVEDTEKRTVSKDGTINKVYRTGMTSTETTYTLLSTAVKNGNRVYTYSDSISITVTPDGSIYDGEKRLKTYLNGTYTQGSNFYTFNNNFSKLTLEVQNDKKMLRPGMNIDAEIIVEKRDNVIAVPLSAVGRGNVVKVIRNTENSPSNIKNEGTETENDMLIRPDYSDGSDPEEGPKGFENGYIPEKGYAHNGGFVQPDETGRFDGNTAERNNSKDGYGAANTDTEFEEVRVTVGISDDEYVEITSGLEVGDIVIIDTSNLASFTQNMQFGGMMGGGMPGGMMGGGMSGGMNRVPMGR